MASSRMYRAKSTARTPRTTKIHRTRSSATPCSRRPPARELLLIIHCPAARRQLRARILGGVLVPRRLREVVVVDLAGVLAVGRRHHRDLLPPDIQLQPWEPGHHDAHRRWHHLVRLAVPGLAPLGLGAVVHQVLELDAPEPVEEVDAPERR